MDEHATTEVEWERLQIGKSRLDSFQRRVDLLRNATTREYCGQRTDRRQSGNDFLRGRHERSSASCSRQVKLGHGACAARLRAAGSGARANRSHPAGAESANRPRVSRRAHVQIHFHNTRWPDAGRISRANESNARRADLARCTTCTVNGALTIRGTARPFVMTLTISEENGILRASGHGIVHA